MEINDKKRKEELLITEDELLEIIKITINACRKNNVILKLDLGKKNNEKFILGLVSRYLSLFKSLANKNKWEEIFYSLNKRLLKEINDAEKKELKKIDNKESYKRSTGKKNIELESETSTLKNNSKNAKRNYCDDGRKCFKCKRRLTCQAIDSIGLHCFKRMAREFGACSHHGRTKDDKYYWEKGQLIVECDNCLIEQGSSRNIIYDRNITKEKCFCKNISWN